LKQKKEICTVQKKRLGEFGHVLRERQLGVNCWMEKRAFLREKRGEKRKGLKEETPAAEGRERLGIFPILPGRGLSCHSVLNNRSPLPHGVWRRGEGGRLGVAACIRSKDIPKTEPIGKMSKHVEEGLIAPENKVTPGGHGKELKGKRRQRSGKGRRGTTEELPSPLGG